MLKIETSFKLPKEFEVKGSPKTLAQAIRVYEARSHYGLADTKGRGEINRTTKKLYKQKGTGGARHGARSAPIFVGGGVAFGPKAKERKLILPQALRKSALMVALSEKAKEGQVFVVSGISTLSSTKEMAAILKKISAKAKRFTISLSGANVTKARFIRNIKGVEILTFKNLNAYQVVKGGPLVIDREAFEAVKEVKAEKVEAKKAAVKKPAVAKKAVKKTVKKGAAK